MSDPNDPVWQRPTIFRALNKAGITWRYYYQDNSVFLANWADWNDPQIQGNVRSISEWYNILASPSADQDLPQVVFIERAGATGLDEHPENNVQLGAQRVQQILNALLTSTAWPDSVFILTYDEGGGLFDHVGPDPGDTTGRCLAGRSAVRPHPGTVQRDGIPRAGHRGVAVGEAADRSRIWPSDYTAMLKLIETRFNVPALTQRDATAADMTDPTNGFFDFSSPHLLQVPTLPTQPTDGACDPTLESSPIHRSN